MVENGTSFHLKFEIIVRLGAYVEISGFFKQMKNTHQYVTN